MSNPTRTYLDFERPIAELDAKIEELQSVSERNGEDAPDVADEVAKLRQKSATQLKNLYAKLDPWQKTMVARHPERPHLKDFLAGLITDFEELSGDRRFSEDHAIVGGLGRFRGRAVVVMGHEKGHDTQTRLKHNFGMARPEGYRKAARLMDLADKFGLPVLTFVDTAGAYPGVGAEERGQSEAIARSTERCLTLGTPIISVITGEGGSGGAVALASANTVMMLEHSIYSVISPEGCASILWRDGAKARDAAIAMKITAQDLIGLKIIDKIIPEPVGGAHRDRDATIKAVGDAMEENLSSLEGLDPATLRRKRRERFLAIGRSLMEPAA
ncbi:MAG TPA: acetyl-CoA carboxylase carboxyl transferase subunit alpha [Oceanicaulis sp.]|jgi:acetyl-CoA carboxylase carboxyl transferase subunit alpha|uniref:Acetyl-coenzyme A carboxylase carboxyl transferase subunit alpha n=1 Tax=Glycocaulis albus TaxID=1382801 RepID=A0ABQ1XCN2_9PROT|nr:acetyl-CoA carboxylase carboxyltransferase subunit alpha [Glycocaulis albus]MBV5257013.1 acetyl-CoA carboxylase carboxyltransferase subunit alpha [Synechococcus moorigangaii CMS01]GGG90592.1 acetyl-coenzyme A carboxylase carboxyl transferase subunit alpha [Glycocaulis albus]HCY54382.1 acetyl-CoA carboxylase carboxyl transferase subunit alpha [Oceanicaulis sp.]